MYILFLYIMLLKKYILLCIKNSSNHDQYWLKIRLEGFHVANQKIKGDKYKKHF